MKPKPGTKPKPNGSVLTMHVQLPDGRSLRKVDFDQLWHLYNPNDTGYSRITRSAALEILNRHHPEWTTLI